MNKEGKRRAAFEDVEDTTAPLKEEDDEELEDGESEEQDAEDADLAAALFNYHARRGVKETRDVDGDVVEIEAGDDVAVVDKEDV
jgi:hypothetical protein